jgi:hypothetical protein
MPLYASDGSTNVSVVNGNTYVGRYAPNGSLNVVQGDGTAYTGRSHPSGAMYVVNAGANVGKHSKTGGLHVSASPNTAGADRVTVVSGSLT